MSSDLAELKSKPIKKAEEKPEREAWGNHCEFFLSSLGLAVGLGNIWRFPYICYSNGGGTFLIPYLVMLLLVGLPLFFMEMILGQYAGLSATKIYARLTPGLKGIGYGMVTIPTIINFYYAVIMAYGFYYLFMGITADGNLPWGRCNDPEINTPNCYSLLDAQQCSNSSVFWNQTCTQVAEFCRHFQLEFDENNFTHCFSKQDKTLPVAVENVTFRVSSSEEFWYKKVLDMSVIFTENGTSLNLEQTSWSNWGRCNWKIAGCLLLTWVLVCAFLIKGVQSYGKVVYFTTLFPYVVLTTLLIYVSFLPGFAKGIEFYLVPDWSKLGNIAVWNAAGGQIFYSLGVAVGSQLLLSSYNDFRANCHRDALLIGLANSLTSIFAGFVVFGVVGFIAHKKNMPIESVVDIGPGLAFIVYPEAVASMKVSPFFSFMFFLMLILLAISSVCAQWEETIAAIIDEFPKLRQKRTPLLIVSCFVAFLCGLPICFQGGFLLFKLMDDRSANAVLVMAFIELVLISWFYGTAKFYGHVEEMGMKLSRPAEYFWKICWVFITPCMIGFITVDMWVNHADDSFLNYVFPTSVVVLGWGIELVSLAIVVFFSIFVCIKRWINGQPLTYSALMKPKSNWGPRPDAISGTSHTNEAFDATNF